MSNFLQKNPDRKIRRPVMRIFLHTCFFYEFSESAESEKRIEVAKTSLKTGIFIFIYGFILLTMHTSCPDGNKIHFTYRTKSTKCQFLGIYNNFHFSAIIIVSLLYGYLMFVVFHFTFVLEANFFRSLSECGEKFTFEFALSLFDTLCMMVAVR